MKNILDSSWTARTFHWTEKIRSRTIWIPHKNVEHSQKLSTKNNPKKKQAGTPLEVRYSYTSDEKAQPGAKNITSADYNANIVEAKMQEHPGLYSTQFRAAMYNSRHEYSGAAHIMTSKPQSSRICQIITLGIGGLYQTVVIARKWMGLNRNCRKPRKGIVLIGPGPSGIAWSLLRIICNHTRFAFN